MKSKRKFSFEDVSEIYFLSRLLGALQWECEPTKQQIKVRQRLRKRMFYASEARKLANRDKFRDLLHRLPPAFHSFY